MIIALFQRNHIISSIFLLVYTFAIRSFSFFDTPVLTFQGNGILSDFLFERIFTSEFVSDLFACLLIFFQAVYLNRLVITNRLSNTLTQLPGMVYILLSSIIPEMLHLTPVLLAQTFFLIALHYMFVLYKAPTYSRELFNAAFAIGIASLFYSSFVGYFPLLLAGLSMLRSIKQINILQVLAALFVTYFLSMTIAFLWGDLSVTWQGIQESFSILSLKMQMDFYHLGYLAFYLIMTVFFLLFFRKYLQKKGIQAQKKIGILLWIYLFFVISLLIQNNVSWQHFLLLNIPGAFFLSESIIYNRNKSLIELIHILIVICTFVLHIFIKNGQGVSI